MITEKNNVFYCDCGFSFLRGHSGAHDCAVGLRNKLAKSEAQCAALAAENAGLKAALEWLYEAVSMPDSGPIPDKYFSAVTNAAAVMHETPATDAFLAEVRASALDEFARAQDEQAKKYYEMSPGCSAQDECQFAASQAWYFAECIRKGVQS